MKSYRAASGPTSVALIVAAVALAGCSSSSSSSTTSAAASVSATSAPSSATTTSASAGSSPSGSPTTFSTSNGSESAVADPSATALPKDFPAGAPTPKLPLHGFAKASTKDGDLWTLQYGVSGDPKPAVDAYTAALKAAGFESMNEMLGAQGKAGMLIKDPFMIVVGVKGSTLMVMVTKTR